MKMLLLLNSRISAFDYAPIEISDDSKISILYNDFLEGQISAESKEVGFMAILRAAFFEFQDFIYQSLNYHLDQSAEKKETSLLIENYLLLTTSFIQYFSSNDLGEQLLNRAYDWLSFLESSCLKTWDFAILSALIKNLNLITDCFEGMTFELSEDVISRVCHINSPYCTL